MSGILGADGQPAGLIKNLQAYQTMRLWTDAYTARLEAVAEAQNDKRMLGRMTDNLKHLDATRVTSTDVKAQADLAGLKANQQHAIRRMQGFDADAHREVMAMWRGVSRKLLATGWALNDALECEITEDKPPKLKMWQGREKPLLWEGREAAMVMAFLKFVEETSGNAVDPRQLVIEQLTAQGITKDNFHLHRDRLLIANPWTGEE